MNRKEELKKLVQMILDGEFYHKSIDPNKLYLLHEPVRREYKAPRDISGYNWGAARTWEMDAGMDEAF